MGGLGGLCLAAAEALGAWGAGREERSSNGQGIRNSETSGPEAR